MTAAATPTGLTRSLTRHEWGLVVGAVLLAFVVRLAFWVVTDRVWEDALITLAHVRNLREGLDLTHHPGEGLVHGFTSALSVLIPLAGEVVVPDSGLTMLRIASLLAGCGAVVVGFLVARDFNLGAWATAFVLVYLAVNQLQIFYGMAGMETQVATLLLLAGAYAVLREREAAAGLLAGLTILARPDLLLWAAIVVLWAWRRGLASLGRVALPAALVVAPWVLFTTIYYGSPIPQTIVAKGLAYTTVPELGSGAGAWLEWLGDRGPTAIFAVLRQFMPFYEDGNVVSAPIDAGLLAVVGLVMVALAIRGAWVSRATPNWWPVLAYLAGFLLYWVVLLPLGYFSWYQPPFMALTAVLIGIGLEHLPRAKRLPTVVPAVLSVLLMVGVALHLPFSLPLDAATQRDVELGVRRTTGIYLAESVPAGEAVVTEAAGYLGYYSRVTLWDHPGLTSPTSLAAMRELPRAERTLTGMVNALQPPWLAIRPHEWRDLQQRYAATAACYEERTTIGQERAPVIELNGLARWNQDWAYLVLQRRAECSG